MIVLLAFETDTERDKFEYIFKKYKNLMLFKAYEILKDYRLAEDATSEAFIRIYKNLHKIKEVDANETIAFVVTIVKNTAITILRKEKKSVTELVEDTQEDRFNLEEHIMSEVSAEKIYEILGQLHENLRQPFLLKFAHGLSHKEIADMIGIQENNVTVRLHRAKKEIAKLLRKEGYLYEK